MMRAQFHRDIVHVWQVCTDTFLLITGVVFGCVFRGVVGQESVWRGEACGGGRGCRVTPLLEYKAQ